MANKVRSLGTVAAASARGITVTSGTNATPIVATITAGHRLKNGDRIGIVGVTGLTAMNGDWTVERVSDTTYRLLGSKGNGTYGGTAIAGALMDMTPHHEKHSALCMIGQPAGAVFVGTLVIEGATQRNASNTNFAYTDSSGNPVDGFTSALLTGEVAIPAATAGQVLALEVNLFRYMSVRPTSYTSGQAAAWLIA